MSIRMTGLVASASVIDQQIFDLVAENRTSLHGLLSHPFLNRIQQELSRQVLKVNDLCERKGATPADLPTPSLRAYQWMRLLSHTRWLHDHVRACAEFLEQTTAFHRSLLPRRYEKISLKIYPSSYLYISKRNRAQLRLEVHEGFIRAPVEVKAAIVQSALHGRSAGQSRLIRAYTRQADFILICRTLNDIGQINSLSSNGKVFDLGEIYDRLNHKYFANRLTRPVLRWSNQAAKRRLGYYEPDSGGITISRRLDRHDVDPLLVEYILYHEMLHQHFGITLVNGRRRAHTREFKRKERQFSGYDQALLLMKSLASQPD